MTGHRTSISSALDAMASRAKDDADQMLARHDMGCR